MRKPFALLMLALVALIVLAPGQALAANEATGLLDRFVNQTSGWWSILRGYALFLFTITLTIEVCLFGVRMALQQSQLGEVLGQFVTLLLFAGFVAAVINNYQAWATGIAVTGLKPLVGELTGNSVDAGQPFAIAAAIVDKVMAVMLDFGLSDIVEALLYIISMLMIIVVFVLISALIIVTTCEFYIIANIGVLLIGLGGAKIFKDYAVNVMRYVLSVAVKLFVLQLVVNIGFAMLSMNDLDASIGSTLDAVRFVDLFFLIGKALILLALAKTLPDTCAGIISGSNVGGGNPLVSIGRSAAAVAAGAVSGGVAGAAMVAASHAIAKGDPAAGGLGAQGIGQTLGGMAKTMWSAHQQAGIAKNPGSMVNQLKSQANSVKALSGGSGDSGGGSSSAPAALPAPPTAPALPAPEERPTLPAPKAVPALPAPENPSAPAASGNAAPSSLPEPPPVAGPTAEVSSGPIAAPAPDNPNTNVPKPRGPVDMRGASAKGWGGTVDMRSAGPTMAALTRPTTNNKGK